MGPGGPWNSSAGPEDALPPCDERRCSAFPLGALVPVTAVCLALFAVGVSGNVVTVLLVGRARALRSSTDLYLGSMAVSDLLVLLGLPLDLYRLWRSRPWVFGPLLCRLSLYLGEGGAYASLLHVAALSAERCLAVRRPLRARARASRGRVRARIAALWAAALLSAAPLPFLVGVEQDAGANRTAAAALFSRECRASGARRGALRLVLGAATAYFALPCLCLAALYALVGRELRRRPPGGRGHRRAVRGLLVVVLAFIVCWLPFHVGRIIYINTEDSRMMYFSQYFNIVALQLFYLSASINPILYNLISKKYRAAARQLLLSRQPKLRGFCRNRATSGDPEGDTGGDTAGYTLTSANTKMAQPAQTSQSGTSEKTGSQRNED